MDDALYAEARDDGWRLMVAIADPTAWISPDSALETEARRRVTSIYFPGGMRPMLPDTLSTGLCSLVADSDRLALVCDHQYRCAGSARRLRDPGSRYPLPGQAQLRRGCRLAGQATVSVPAVWMTPRPPACRRSTRPPGSCASGGMRMPWSMKTARITACGWTTGARWCAIDRVQPTRAHRLVEDCMIAANRCAARFLDQHGDGLFITHGGIRNERLDGVRQLVKSQAPALADIDPATPEGFARILRELPQPEGDTPVRAAIMRQLERAELAARPAPHQGMGLPQYTTFTSPSAQVRGFPGTPADQGPPAR